MRMPQVYACCGARDEIRKRFNMMDTGATAVPLTENQNVQRCAFDTKKSRNTCTRATDFSSSG
jgi:hypothetical protein